VTQSSELYSYNNIVSDFSNFLFNKKHNPIRHIFIIYIYIWFYSAANNQYSNHDVVSLHYNCIIRISLVSPRNDQSNELFGRNLSHTLTSRLLKGISYKFTLIQPMQNHTIFVWWKGINCGPILYCNYN